MCLRGFNDILHHDDMWFQIAIREDDVVYQSVPKDSWIQGIPFQDR